MTKNNQRIMLVGPRSTSNVISGMRIGFDLLISGFEERHLPHIIIDRSIGMSDKIVGSLTLKSVLANIYLFLLYWFKLFSVRSVYITIGISRFGFLRDALMIWSAWLFGKRKILHLKGGGFLSFYEESPPLLKKIIRHTLAKVDIIIVLGHLLVDQFAFVPGVSKKLRVVPNGLPKKLQKSSLEPKNLDAKTSMRLLYLSNMIPTKGYMDVLKACKILQQRQVPIFCDFCGAFVRTINDDGVEYSEDYFYQLVDSLELDEIIKYHGTILGEAKQRFLQGAHVFILPTYYPWEGQPISIIEALAFGLPVISTHYRGIPEQVVNGYNGFLVSHRSPKEIADAIETMWRDPAKYQDFSRNALAHFRQNFTQSAHLNRLIPLIIGLEE